MQKGFLPAILALFIASSLSAAETSDLNEKNYAAAGAQKAVVIFHVNWGRYWRCAGLENAQLQALQFTRLEANEAKSTDTISLEAPSKLLAKDSFVPYVLLIESGQYALSGFDVKAARSLTDIGHVKGDAADLIKDKKAVGGSFSVAPGEIVYIGHFGLDCAGEPIPWRYYIQGSRDFDRYVDGFRKEYPFIHEKPVLYRLFSTSMFGEAYSLK